jgi:hypothetical protein
VNDERINARVMLTIPYIVVTIPLIYRALSCNFPIFSHKLKCPFMNFGEEPDKGGLKYSVYYPTNARTDTPPPIPHPRRNHLQLSAPKSRQSSFIPKKPTTTDAKLHFTCQHADVVRLPPTLPDDGRNSLEFWSPCGMSAVQADILAGRVVGVVEDELGDGAERGTVA